MGKEVNGKVYPMWNQFVERSREWEGGILKDLDMGHISETKIIEIKLSPNGEDSAFFSIVGEKFNSGFDVRYGGVTGSKILGAEFLHFSGYGGHVFGIKKPN